MRNRTGIIRPFTDAFLIRRSGLLHVAYYRSQFYQELKADRYLLRLSPVLHYVLFGAFDGKNPNPLFDTEYYRDNNPDVVQSGQNPLVHYLRYGAQKRLNPSPYFDTRFYIDQNSTALGSGPNPLWHYFQHGRQKGCNPHPLFARNCNVPKPLAVSHAEGRDWLQRGLGATSVADPCTAHRPNRIIRFEWDTGGWNNIRMQAEVMVCLAASFGRALALPAPARWYLVPGEHSHLFDYFDEAAFRAAVPVLPAGTGMGDEWKVPAHLAAINTVRLKKAEYLEQQDRESWYFPQTARMFGCFASVFGSNTAHYALIQRAFRVRADLLDQTIELLKAHGLNPGGYLAAHVRRGDFQYQAMRHLSVADVVKALRSHGADTAGTLLIVSDMYDDKLLDACRAQGWKPVCWATEHGGDARLSGVLDMLCCCLGWRFVGTRLSTFSTGIIQWRGYVSRVAGTQVDAIPRFTVELDQVPWWAAVDEHAWLSIGSSGLSSSGGETACGHAPHTTQTVLRGTDGGAARGPSVP